MSLITDIEQRLGRGYAIEREIGRGGTSRVYVARRAGDDECVVVKVMRPGRTGAEEMERFLLEMQVMKRLEHPSIVPILEAGEASGALFYTMPYLGGETLRDRLAREGALPIADALRIAGGVTRALGHAHSNGVVHRDVKPENILLTEAGARLMDFGFAHAPGLATHEAIRRDANFVFGTPEYMSPEQVNAGGRGEDWRSDFYSLGCVMYEMLVGGPPFAGEAPRAMMKRKTAEVPLDVRAFRPDVPPDVAAIVRKALSLSRTDRFSTATSMQVALDRALEQLEPAPPADSAEAAAGSLPSTE